MGDPLMLDPPSACFPSAGGQSQHAVINQSPERVAVKVGGYLLKSTASQMTAV